jgi:hypothetical protein
MRRRKWWVKSRVCEGDATYGFLGTLMEEMGVAQMDIEGAESLSLGPMAEMRCVRGMMGKWKGKGACRFPEKASQSIGSPNMAHIHRRRRAQQDLQKATARIPIVESSDFWRQADADGVAVYAHGALGLGVLVLVFLSVAGASVAWTTTTTCPPHFLPTHRHHHHHHHHHHHAVMTEDGLFVEATNSMSKKWFRGIDELLCHDQPKHRMLSNLLMLAYVPCRRPHRSIDRSFDPSVLTSDDTVSDTYTQSDSPRGPAGIQRPDHGDGALRDAAQHHQVHQGARARAGWCRVCPSFPASARR